MKRTYVLLAGVLATIAAAGSAVAGAQSTVPTAHASRATEVVLRHTSLGSILTTSSGFTLYEFTRDHGSENSCVKIHDCAQAWPALETVGAADGRRRRQGARCCPASALQVAPSQVTYAGHPLYTFSEDSAAPTDYVGVNEFGGDWDALSASGQAVK